MSASDFDPPDWPNWTLSRRLILQAASASLAVVIAPIARALADERTSQFETAFKKLSGDKTVADGPVKMELPELAENGNMVPFTISVDSPMSDEDHVKTLTIFSTGNPQPVIATFHFSPLSGRAVVSGRLRLARTQDLIAVAELNTGVLVKGTTKVSVNVGGCGAG